jgi:hypothetical protein
MNFLVAGIVQSVQRLITGWTAVVSKFESGWGQELFFFSSRPVLGFTQPLIQWVPWARRLGREADHSPQLMSRSRKYGPIIHYPIRLHGVKHTDNFAFNNDLS